MTAIFRKEIKYVIPVTQYYRLRTWLEQIMQLDTNGIDGAYGIRSLYFDSLHDKDLYDNLDGVSEKRKIRLRVYQSDLSKGKLECKAKDGSDGTKYAIILEEKEMKEMIKGNYSCLQKKDSPIARQLYQRMMSGAYWPKTIVEYQRVAYTNPVSNTRVTFDTKIRGTATGDGLFEENPGFFPLLPDDYGVLEIKYDQFLPYTIKELLKHLDCLPQAYSKYTIARSLY